MISESFEKGREIELSEVLDDKDLTPEERWRYYGEDPPGGV